MPAGRTDGRRERGDRTRRAIAVRAAELASVHGLEGVSLARAAADLGVSKSGVQAAFQTKQDLQLAAVAAASDIFMERVVTRAMSAPPGARRLRALAAAWLDYVEQRVFPGGCFMVATLAEFDSRPGPVRDALASARARWLDLLGAEAAVAEAAGELHGLPPDLVAFDIDSVLAAANVARNMTGSSAPLSLARQLLDLRLAAADIDPLGDH